MLIEIVNRLVPALSDAASLVLVTFAIVLIFRTSFTTNFSQGMIATSAAYITIAIYYGILQSIFPGGNIFILTMTAYLSGIIVGFLIGIFIDVILVRKSKYATPLTKQIITMGVVLIILGMLPTFFSNLEMDMPQMPRFFNDVIRIEAMDGLFIIQQKHLFNIFVVVIVVGLVFAILQFTKWGLGVRATAANERVAGLMGINTKFITMLSWGLAGALGSLAALLYATSQGQISSALMSDMQVNGFLAAILGGFSSFLGPIIGAIIIPVLSTFISYATSSIMVGGSPLSIYYKVFVYIIILVIILFKPLGIFGKKVIKKV